MRDQRPGRISTRPLLPGPHSTRRSVRSHLAAAFARGFVFRFGTNELGAGATLNLRSTVRLISLTRFCFHDRAIIDWVDYWAVEPAGSGAVAASAEARAPD